MLALSMSKGLLLIAAGALLLGSRGASCGVRAWQDSMVLETYAEGPPETTPVMDDSRGDAWCIRMPAGWI